VLGRGASFDAAVAEAARRLGSPLADAVMLGFTVLASGPFTLVVVLGAASAALVGGDRRAAAALGAAWCASQLASQGLKLVFARARPSFPYTWSELSTPAFPSGHAANAVVVFGLLALLAARRWPRRRGAFAGAAAAVALGAGASRVYLGVHWPTDVLAGWAVGVVILVLLASALPAGDGDPLSPEARARGGG
jgi:undecaprenyl-diphosphatase